MKNEFSDFGLAEIIDKYVRQAKSLPKLPSGPEFGLEPDFKPGDCSRIGPGQAGEHPTDGGAGDSGLAPYLPDTDVIGEGFQPKDELANGLDGGVVTNSVGPSLASVPGCGSGSSAHDANVAGNPPPTLLSSIPGGKLTSEVVAWKHQQEEIDRLIEDYTPKNIPPANWARIESEVRDIVRSAEPPTYFQAHNMYGAVAYMAEWAWKKGYSLEPTDLLTHVNIDRYIDEACKHISNTSKKTRRSALRSLHRQYFGSANLGVKNQWPDPTDSLPPYTDEEMDEFIFWAKNQASDTNTRAAHAMLGLSGGAGLAAEDIVTVNVGGVRCSKGLMVVTVGGRRPRKTPVRPGFEDFILIARKGLPRQSRLFLPNRVNSARSKAANFVKESTGDVKPSFQRLRITWLVYWIQQGLPLPVLLRAAGLKELHSISRYICHLPMPTDRQVADTFRKFS